MLLFNTGFGTLQFSSWPACWLLISGNTICHDIEVWFVLWFILWTGLCFLSDILYLSRAALLKCNHPCTLLCRFYGYLVDWLVGYITQAGWLKCYLLWDWDVCLDQFYFVFDAVMFFSSPSHTFQCICNRTFSVGPWRCCLDNRKDICSVGVTCVAYHRKFCFHTSEWKGDWENGCYNGDGIYTFTAKPLHLSVGILSHLNTLMIFLPLSLFQYCT